LVLAKLIIYQALAFIQWNWDFDTWHWFARLILVLMYIGTFSNFVKEIKK